MNGPLPYISDAISFLILLSVRYYFLSVCFKSFNYLMVHSQVLTMVTRVPVWLTIKGRKEMFYLKMHSTHFIYGYLVSDTNEEINLRLKHISVVFVPQG